MLKLGRVAQFKMPFLVLVFVFNFDLFKFSAAILEKGLLGKFSSTIPEHDKNVCFTCLFLECDKFVFYAKFHFVYNDLVTFVLARRLL